VNVSVAHAVYPEKEPEEAALEEAEAALEEAEAALEELGDELQEPAVAVIEALCWTKGYG